MRLSDGDQYWQDNVIYQCTVNDEKTGPVAYGCLMNENGVETKKKFGCFWTEGDAPYQYEYTCKYDKERNTALKIKIRCSYKSSDGIFRVEPGCYTKTDTLGVGCVKDSSGDLTTRVFPADKLDSSLGLRDC
jgi:hypothetical protein